MPQPLVVLMCGLAGSGKTTFAQALEARGFVRLSVDEELWRRYGRYGVDYAADRYSELSAVVRLEVRRRMVSLVEQGQDVVVDSAFWQRAARDDVKALVEAHGGHWRLVHLQLDEDELRRRLAVRAERFDANAAFPITDEMLTGYLADFEPPQGEGEEDGSALVTAIG
jgi:predicted kinase